MLGFVIVEFVMIGDLVIEVGFVFDENGGSGE